MIKGLILDLGGIRYEVPPLALGDLERLQDRLSAYQGGIDPASISLVLDTAHAALRRNYPEMTRDQVGTLVDLGNMAEVFDAVMDISGLKRRAQKDVAAGKAAGQG